MAPKAIHDHTLTCEPWKSRFGAPWPKFKFSSEKVMYNPEAIEGVNYVQCKMCAVHGWDFRFYRMADHLKIHGVTEEDYLRAYGSPIRVAATLERRKASVRSKYGCENVFQSSEVKEKIVSTNRKKYGRSTARGSEEVESKIAQTNIERYGSENPFGSDVIQPKIRQTLLDKYGVTSPQKSEVVRDKTKDTNLKRYGVPYFFQVPEFPETLRLVSQDKYGTDHPMQAQGVKDRQKETLTLRYGADFRVVLAAKAVATSMFHHGGVHHLAHPAVLEKKKATVLARYGVDNVSKDPTIKDKIIAAIKKTFSGIPNKTSPEKIVEAGTGDNVIYTGDWSFWVTWASGRRKNPDFVVLTPEQLDLYRSGTPLESLGIKEVIEVNGDFWHTSLIGKTKDEREEEFKSGYSSVGIKCHILWESDLNLGFSGLALHSEPQPAVFRCGIEDGRFHPLAVLVLVPLDFVVAQVGHQPTFIAVVDHFKNIGDGHPRVTFGIEVKGNRHQLVAHREVHRDVFLDCHDDPYYESPTIRSTEF